MSVYTVHCYMFSTSLDHFPCLCSFLRGKVLTSALMKASPVRLISEVKRPSLLCLGFLCELILITRWLCVVFSLGFMIWRVFALKKENVRHVGTTGYSGVVHTSRDHHSENSCFESCSCCFDVFIHSEIFPCAFLFHDCILELSFYSTVLQKFWRMCIWLVLFSFDISVFFPPCCWLESSYWFKGLLCYSSFR